MRGPFQRQHKDMVVRRHGEQGRRISISLTTSLGPRSSFVYERGEYAECRHLSLFIPHPPNLPALPAPPPLLFSLLSLHTRGEMEPTAMRSRRCAQILHSLPLFSWQVKAEQTRFDLKLWFPLRQTVKRAQSHKRGSAFTSPREHFHRLRSPSV